MVPSALVGFEFVENYQWLLIGIHYTRVDNFASGCRVLGAGLCWINRKHV